MTGTGPRWGGVVRQVHLLLRDGTGTGLTDRELLERFREGGECSESAFSSLVERHGPLVLGVCRTVLRDPNDVEDAFQATFLVLVRRAGSLWVRDSIGPWLYSVAGRVALRARADARRRQRYQGGPGDPAELRVVGSESDHVRDEESRLLHEELTRLPERWRDPLVLCHLEGLTHEQASRNLGVPVGTVRSRLARGRERLRDRLIRRGLAPSAALAASQAGLSGEASASAAMVPASLVHKTVIAGLGLRSGWGMAGPISAVTFKLTRGILMSMLLAKAKTAGTVLVLAGGMLAVSMRVGGAGPVQPGPDLASAIVAIEEPKPKDLPSTVPKDASEKATSATTDSPAPARAKPVESTVRIKRYEEGKVTAVGSGTIIISRPNVSFILTSGRILAPRRTTSPNSLEEGKQPRIVVELVEEPNKSENPTDRENVTTFFGDDASYHFDKGLDLGLIRINLQRQFPASPIVPKRWSPSPRMAMISVGYPKWGIPTALPTKIITANFGGLVGNPDYRGIECEKAPDLGRIGGGLFTDDGYLAGVCNYADPANDHGIYAAPTSIHRFLDRFLDPQALKRVDEPNVIDQKGNSPKPPAQPEATEQAVKTPVEPSRPPQPSIAAASNRPLQSTVRVTNTANRKDVVGAGTVIASDADSSVVLTNLRLVRGSKELPKVDTQAQQKIRVDFFSWESHEQILPLEQSSVEGTVIDYDEEAQLGLIRIKPGRILPVSLFAPAIWWGKKMSLLAVNCVPGESPSTWTMMRSETSGTSTTDSRSEIRCQGEVRQGQIGGGLFTPDGFLVGVCRQSNPETKSAVYVSTTPIFRLLFRNKLSHLYSLHSIDESDLMGRIMQAERDLSKPDSIRELEEVVSHLNRRKRVIDAEAQRTRQIEDRVTKLLTEVKKRQDSGPKKPPEPERPNPLSPRNSEPAGVGPSNPDDLERRMKELEQKLDRVLKKLEQPVTPPIETRLPRPNQEPQRVFSS